MSLRPLAIAPGEIVGILGTDRRCVITQLLPGNLVGVRDCGSKEPPEQVSVAVLTHAPAPSAILKPIEDRPDLELSRVSPEDWELAKRRLEIIRPLLEMRRPPAVLVKQHARSAGCHWTTLYLWMRLFRRSGGTVTSLLDRLPSVPKGSKRLPSEIEEIVTKVINENYLTKQRLRITKINEALEAECIAQGIPLVKHKGSNHLYKPHINTIRNRIRAISAKKRDAEREGKDKATKYEARGDGFVASFPLEYVQIDHTQVNVILCDEKNGYIMGRPWITVAIDVFSRMIVGFYISFERPGALATGLCVAHLILPKDEWLQEYAAAFPQMPQWPCWGRPVNLHADNAPEFRGDTLRRACQEYNINPVFRPVKTPHYGAHIESLMDKLSEEFRTLPGATFSNPVERGKHYDSEAEAAISFGEFYRWLANHICCIYHYRPHSGLEGKSPLGRWDQGMYQGTELAPPRGRLPDRYIGEDARRLQMDFLPVEDRVISEEGVRIDKIHYMSPVLRRWINTKDPENPKRKRYFTFRRDPRDISIIYFWNHELAQYEAIPYRNNSRTPMTLWELRAARTYLRDKRNLPNGKHDEKMIFEAMLKNRELVAAAMARKGKFKAAGKFQKGIHTGRPKPLGQQAGEPHSKAEDNLTDLGDGREDVTAFGDLEID